jgi:hypothetical protein
MKGIKKMATGMQPVRSIILKVLTDLHGKPVHCDTIVARTDLSPVQVKAGMNHMIKDGLPVEVIQPANVWIFRPDPAETESTAPSNRTGELWEVIGHAKSGAIILRDENGTLYRATEME